MLLQKSKENIIKIPAFKAESHLAAGHPMGAFALCPLYRNTTYLEPFAAAVLLPVASPRGWLAGAALYTRAAGTRKVQGRMKWDSSSSLAVKCEPCTSLTPRSARSRAGPWPAAQAGCGAHRLSSHRTRCIPLPGLLLLPPGTRAAAQGVRVQQCTPGCWCRSSCPQAGDALVRLHPT